MGGIKGELSGRVWGVGRGAWGCGVWGGCGGVWVWGGWMGLAFGLLFHRILLFFLIIHTKLKIISCFYLNFIQNLRLYLTFILTLTKIKIKVGY